MSRDTGYKRLKKESEHNFEMWGKYMKRCQHLENKIQKLKSLIFLTDESVSNEVANSLTLRQWNEFIKAYP